MNADDLITVTMTAAEWEHMCRLLIAPVNPVLSLIAKIQQQAVTHAMPAGDPVTTPPNGGARPDTRDQ